MTKLAAVLVTQVLCAQVKPIVSQRTLTDQVNLVRVAPRFATAIRVPEPVSSVVVGDPSKFLAEHSDKEATLVLVKPVVEGPAESNLLITTVRGRQLSFLLRTEGNLLKPVDFVLLYKLAGSFLVDETDLGSVEVPRTERIGGVVRPVAVANAKVPESSVPDPLAGLLARQRRASMPDLYGSKPPTQAGTGDRVRAGVSEVLDQGTTVIVLFSVVNPQDQAIEIMPPQIQLAGKTRKGVVIGRDRWTTSEQLPIQDFRLTRRRLSPGERSDGVVVFQRPSFKQSNESVLLQIAESGAVDKPALAPIGFGVSAIR